MRRLFHAQLYRRRIGDHVKAISSTFAARTDEISGVEAKGVAEFGDDGFGHGGDFADGSCVDDGFGC